MSAFNKRNPKPRWLCRPPAEGTTGVGHRYYNKLWNAQPPWQDPIPIRHIYAEARRRRLNGEDVEVDHIMPLQHALFCGLHVPWNLQIVPKALNAWKSNEFHPEHPQQQLFDECDPFWSLEQCPNGA